MKLNDILPPSECLDSQISFESEVAHVCDAAQDIRPRKTLFFLIDGQRHPAADRLPEILAKGPMAVVCEQSDPQWSTSVPIVTVPCVRRAYANALSRMLGIDYDKMSVIGITGTNGKTSTATMLAAILHAAGKKVGFIGTGEIRIGARRICAPTYSMTTPDPEILYPALQQMQQERCRYVVMEVSSHALALQKTAPIRFACAIFTNFGSDHMDFHKSIEDYFLAKASLFRASRFGVLNGDDPASERVLKTATCPCVRVGAVFRSPIMARQVEDRGRLGSRFLYKSPNVAFLMDLKMPGIYNVYNAALALTAGIHLGVRPCIAKKAVGALTCIPGRMETIAQAPRVVIDYAHTEEALKNALQTLVREKKSGEKLITVFGCGGERDREKRPKMGKVAEALSDFTIVTQDNSRGEDPDRIIRDILAGFSDASRRRVVTDRKRAIECAMEIADDRDTIVIAGKGREPYQIDSAGYHPFDERKIVLEALKKRKNGENTHDEN